MISIALTPIIATVIIGGFYAHRLASGNANTYSAWLISYSFILLVNITSSVITSICLLSELSDKPGYYEIAIISTYPQLSWVMSLIFNALLKWTHNQSVRWTVNNQVK